MFYRICIKGNEESQSKCSIIKMRTFENERNRDRPCSEVKNLTVNVCVATTDYSRMARQTNSIKLTYLAVERFRLYGTDEYMAKGDLCFVTNTYLKKTKITKNIFHMSINAKA
jgi:hypothetical protein